jgi:hypothetical protein
MQNEQFWVVVMMVAFTISNLKKMCWVTRAWQGVVAGHITCILHISFSDDWIWSRWLLT